ncbi:hypothetical protein BC008_43800 [Mastigocoleus testarum BC008]|uniref:non-specific protein-tyrosine kinase n=2 Tax=Mastigocoleus TaxID=996924 RepID=A0A0V7ZSQ0_9CYAN|nr:hypothetical protein BC008_43800 [Mastigocoleus testarum BC008]
MEYQEYSSNLEKYIHILRRRWVPASIVFVIIFSSSFIFVSMKKPIFVAEGKLRLRKINVASNTSDAATNLSKSDSRVEQKNISFKTEVEIIGSVPLVKQTINKLKLKDSKGKYLRAQDIINNRLDVNRIKGTDLILVSYQDVNPKIAANVVNTLMNLYLNNTSSLHREKVLENRQLIKKQLPQAENIVSKSELALRRFKEKNQVLSSREETVKLIDSLRDLQTKISEHKSQLAGIKAQSQTIQNSLGISAKEVIVLTSLTQSNSVNKILQNIQQVESKIAEKSTILKVDHPELLNLENKLINLEKTLGTRIKKVAGERKKAVRRSLNLGGLKQQLSLKLIDLEAQKQGLKSEIEALLTLENSYQQRLNNLPKLEQQQRQLERQLQNAQSNYSVLLKKLQDNKISENQNLGNAQIVAKAEFPERPISSGVLSYVSSGLLGTLFFVTTICILEVRDKSIRTVEQAKNLTGLTLLGIIPEFGKSSELFPDIGEVEPDNIHLVMNNHPNSPVSDYYRMLRANLKFISTVKELNIIVVTSSVPNEGKSTVAANLAMVMAQMESKVLLVDGDLHSPVQNRAWKIPDNQGLSNVVLGQFDLKTAVKQVKPNLDILTAGKEYIDNLHIFDNDFSPPSPGLILDSKQMGNLVKDFTASYDFVIIDAPSLSIAADAGILGNLADGILFVVRPGVVDLANAYFAKEFLEHSGQNLIGQVVNGATLNPKRRRQHNFLRNYKFSAST